MTPATEAPPRTRTGSIPTTTTEPSIQVAGRMGPRYDEILTPEAVAFLTELHQRFGARRHDRLADRMRRRFEIGNGHDPRFRDDTAHIREDAEWQVAGAGPGLEDRRVEITGPTDPKMTINALNSGARVWLADQEDATSPTWKNVIEGQLSLRDAIRGELSFTSPEGQDLRGHRRAHPHHRDAPARLAPGRGPSSVHRPFRSHDGGIRFARRLRPVLLPQRAAADRERPRPLLLHRQARIERRGEAVGRRLHVQRAVHRHPARHDPRDRAHRDAAGRVRDGGDPLRTARSLRGPERRTLGLHLLDHQELPRPRGAIRAARPQRGHDDRAVHARLHRTARARRATSAGPSRSAA